MTLPGQDSRFYLCVFVCVCRSYCLPCQGSCLVAGEYGAAAARRDTLMNRRSLCRTPAGQQHLGERGKETEGETERRAGARGGGGVSGGLD